MFFGIGGIKLLSSKSLPVLKGKMAFSINLLSQIAVIAAQMIISLYLTPVVLNKMGAEAYGFVGLVNNFVSYVTVITTALNSLAGRFITVAHHSGKRDEAKEYYSSVFYANCVMAILVLISAAILAANIESLVIVSPELVEDLRKTILLAFANCALGLVAVVFGVAAFIKNQLYLNSLSQLLSSITRAVLLCLLFTIALPHMWYYSAAAIVASAIFLSVQVWITKKVTPEYQVRLSHFSGARVKEIIKSGIWTSVQSINNFLLSGLDLWVSNVFVGAYQMGVFSVAKTVPNALLSMSGNFANLFYPKCAEHYARGEKEELADQFILAMKFTAGVMLVPLMGLIAFGFHFYTLWLPFRTHEELDLIQSLAVLTIISLISSALVEPLYYVNTLTNRLKGSVLITFGFSVLVIVIEFSLLAFSNYNGLYVIAAVSSIVMSVRHCVVQPGYAAKMLELPISTFYKTLAREIIGLSIVLSTFTIIAKMLPFSSWLEFCLSCCVAAMVGYVELLLVLLNNKERSIVFRMLFRKVR